MRAFLAGVRYEATVVRQAPGELSWLFVAPLYAVILLVIVRHAGRQDLGPYAVLGPAMMALVGMAVVSAGGLIDRDRGDAVLELEVAAPAALPVVLLGRIVAIATVGLVSVAETFLVAGIGFGQWIAVPHPGVFAGTLVLVVLGTGAAGTVMAAVFVLARSARTFQNALTFPLFVLGGAVVPVSLLPDWLRVCCRVVYLSWATDLLRASTRPEPVDDLWWRMGAVAGLSALTLAGGLVLVRLVVDRIRTLGTVGHA